MSRIGVALAIAGFGVEPPSAWAHEPLPVPDIPVGLAGDVYAMARQADGAVIIGGDFSMIDGVPRRHLARLRADGSLDPDWNPSADGIVLSVALDAHGRVYIGGAFHAVDGLDRNCLARIASGGHGEVDPRWNPGERVDIDCGDYADGGAFGIDVLTVGAYGDVFAGGDISSAQLGHRDAIRISADADAAIDATWNPSVGNVGDILPDGKGSLYVAGSSVLAKIPETGGSGVAGWRRHFSDSPHAIAVGADGSLYVASGVFGFDPAHDEAPRYVARIAPGSDGEFDPTWNPPCPAPVDALAVDGDVVYATLDETGVVLWSARSGSAFAAWQTPGERVRRLVPGADGSLFASVYGSRRALVRLDGSDGHFLAVADAALPGVVNVIAVQPDGGTIVGGHFSVAGTVPRDNLLRLDRDGRLDAAWHPSTALRSVDALAVDAQGNVYAGGESTAFVYEGNSILRPSKLLRIDGGGDGTVDADWSVTADGGIHALAPDAHGALYVGGYFTQVADVARENFARVSLHDASVLPDRGTTMDAVSAIVVDEANDALYLTGGFSVDSHPIDGASSLARFSNATGGLRWKRTLPGEPLALGLAPEGMLYVGGEFVDTAEGTANDVLAFTIDGEPDARWNAATAIHDGHHRIALTLLLDTDAIHLGGSRYGDGLPDDGASSLIGRSRIDGAEIAPSVVVDGTAIHAIARAANGSIYLGGAFGAVDGFARVGLAAFAGGSAAIPIRAHSAHARPEAPSPRATSRDAIR